MSYLKATATILTLQLGALAAQADLLIVPDEFATVEAACLQAFAGDSVGIRPGIYPSDRAVLRPGVTLLGLTADSTEVELVSVEYYPCLHAVEGADPTIIQGITIRIDEIAHCVIRNANANLIVQNCYLCARPDDWGEADLIATFSDITIRRSVLEFYPEASGVTLYAAGMSDISTMTEDCVIIGYSGATRSAGGSVTHEFKNCTFDMSIGAYQYAGYSWALNLTFVNCIFTQGLWCADGPEWQPDSLELRFNDFVEWPPEPDCGDQVGNFSADPLFCDAEARDYRLQADSPCRGAGEGGEDVGARLGYCYPVSDVLERTNSRLDFAMMPFPNPTGNGIHFAIQSPGEAKVEVAVLDVTGGVVWRRVHQLGRGVSNLSWDGHMAGGAPAPSGAYYIRVQSDNAPVSLRPVLLVR